MNKIDGADLWALPKTDASQTFADFTIYRDVAATITVLNDLWGGSFPLHSVEIARTPPNEDNISLQGKPIIFDAPQTVVLWNSQLNRQPLHHGDPEMHAAYLAMCREMPPKSSPKDDVIGILRSYIAKGKGAPVSLSMLAANAGTTERTLQRRLKTHGLVFREIADEARYLEAIEMLKRSEKPIAEIAFRLGYSDTISFSHAFRRWSGNSPAAARRG